MIVMEFGIVRWVGEDNLGKAISDKAAQGYDPIHVIWTGHVDPNAAKGHVVLPNSPVLNLIPTYTVVVMRVQEVADRDPT